MTSATDRLCDDDGYPTEEAVNALIVWPWDDPAGFLAHAELLWCGSGHVEHDGDEVRFITGGWSGCESVINAMQDNPLLWARVWLSSHRGGLYVLSAKRGATERDRIADAETRGRAHGALAAALAVEEHGCWLVAHEDGRLSERYWEGASDAVSDVTGDLLALAKEATRDE